MLRKIGFSLLCAASIVSTNVYSVVTNIMQPSMSIDYELMPNEPQLFVNYLYWDLQANCVITTNDESNELFVEALAKQGTINDVILVKGATMRIIVRQGDTLKINAQSGAKVKITNLGQNTIKASCST
ncbi:hypothetical protein [Legionella worsleiensis]|uniref:Uncharacterized protein n=1 Tax=Legionella worsleiensis TaxID=45076 RepID=A0A0W1A3N6_9GAMM|nr:hypothetical protein [Legionella worsleiensis]KTD75996.1 hypothetical protein Lwor_2562 [Legionella worsleiensis]STY33009.1 Uncharacterised protein [Legionella worsleiensis]